MKNNLMDELALEGFVGIYEEVKSNRLFTGKGLERKIFAQTADGIDRALFFDAIEILDTYINLD